MAASTAGGSAVEVAGRARRRPGAAPRRGARAARGRRRRGCGARSGSSPSRSAPTMVRISASVRDASCLDDARAPRRRRPGPCARRRGRPGRGSRWPRRGGRRCRAARVPAARARGASSDRSRGAWSRPGSASTRRARRATAGRDPDHRIDNVPVDERGEEVPDHEHQPDRRMTTAAPAKHRIGEQQHVRGGGQRHRCLGADLE